jgi:hypothetical protein
MQPGAKFLSNGVWYNKLGLTVNKITPNAEHPFKERFTDPGYIITAVSRSENRAEDLTSEVNTFQTGLVIAPPLNYHCEIIPHPSLYKAGYMLVGPLVIPPGSMEELVIPLYKYKDSEDLELPFMVGLMMVRSTEYSDVGASRDFRRVEEERPEKSTGAKGKPKKGGNHLF